MEKETEIKNHVCDFKLVRIDHPFFSHQLECEECGHVQNRLAIF